MGTRLSRNCRAVVTGAGIGIGAAFAVELAERGSAVVCSDIDVDAAHRTVDQIAEHGGKALAVRCDVSSLADVQALADEAQSWLSSAPTLVVNNAGVGAGGTKIGETAIEEWNQVLGINLNGVIHGCHVFVPILRAAGRGGIINVASSASFVAAPTMGPYNVSKAGVVAISETLAAEFSGTGLRVSVLCPTFVKTNILNTEHITPRSSELAEQMMRVTGMSPERVARICLDAYDRGQLYVLPQLDPKALWRTKRFSPAAFTRATGLLGRVTPS